MPCRVPPKPNPPKIGRLAGLAGLRIGDAAEEGTVEAEGKLQALAADGDAAVHGPRQVVTMVERAQYQAVQVDGAHQLTQQGTCITRAKQQPLTLWEYTLY